MLFPNSITLKSGAYTEIGYIQMIQIEPILLKNYSAVLNKNRMPENEQYSFIKWLRYYLDFCHKYGLEKTDSNNLPRFIEKLRSKKQNSSQQRQAFNAVQLFYSISPSEAPPESFLQAPVVTESNMVTVKENQQNYFPGKSAKNSNIDLADNINFRQAWLNALSALADEIKVRHYSPKTLKSYRSWAIQFQTFTNSKDPELLDSDAVKSFLTYQAVERNVSASSQNLAFNALLFFYRHVLGREFGKIDGVVRAKKRPYIPVVLSKKEVHMVLDNLSYPYDLVGKLLYGCGLRLFESLNLRIHNFNFDAGILTVHGKGKKVRTVPIPEIVAPELKAHMDRVYNLHQIDLADNYDGAFMFDRLEKKYKGAGKEFIWQWFFPAKSLTFVKELKENRRYHLHDTHVQRAIKKAVGKARLTKRATAHTFRTAMPAICWKQTMIFAPFRNF
jgi:integrase